MPPLFLPPGSDETRELASEDRCESLLFDIYRASFRITKTALEALAG
ncbi:MAG: hypothetical protein M3346_03590 [Actinomycetota bacterium]|nr:hypothetical protein [Actinomycetota bacterium]